MSEKKCSKDKKDDLISIPSVPGRIAQVTFEKICSKGVSDISEVEVKVKGFYDIETGAPVKDGVLDSRLGASSMIKMCSVCDGDIYECSGHFGHINLVLPVFHIGFIKYVYTILQKICKSCGTVLISDSKKIFYLKKLRGEINSLKKKEIIKKISNECKAISTCPRCMGYNGPVKKITNMKIYHEKKVVDSDGKGVEILVKEELDPLKTKNLFEIIPKGDYELLGVESLDGMILNALPVPPTMIRPSVPVGSEFGSNEDDLTIKLSKIIHCNDLLKKSIEKGNALSIILEDWDFLQLQCATLVNSDAGNENPIRGIIQRLKGKHGRFRGNLSGKRVNFSGRTVISPDPNISVEEVGVPKHMAKILTIEEKVTDFNKKKLQTCIKNGPNVHPGANFILKRNSKIRKFIFKDRAQEAKELEIGDIVERHLMDKDFILFNRQPSLHRQSIMSHRVRVFNDLTLKLNVCVCTPYNADFDGDEMNIHVPQTIEARAEAKTLMRVKENMTTAKNGELLIAPTQDFITALYLLSSKDKFFDIQKTGNIISWFSGKNRKIKIKPAITRPVKLFTGKQIIEVLIEDALYSCENWRDSLNIETNNNNYKKVNYNEIFSALTEAKLRDENFEDSKLEETGEEARYGTVNPFNMKENIIGKVIERFILLYQTPSDNVGILNYYDTSVIFFRGFYVSGRLDKSIIGSGNMKNSLLYRIFRISKTSCVNFMDSVSKLCSRILSKLGFSIGLNDVQPTEQMELEKQKIFEKAFIKCDEEILKFKEGKLGAIPGLSHEETVEKILSSTLSQVRDECGTVCINNLSKNNSPLIMHQCGSKGSKINISQMVACVGQQIISGERIPSGFSNRTLPHFSNNLHPQARGFVANSFLTGLNPTEFFFHAASGREGLVDTAVKTAETGYMQRRLMKALEDVNIAEDYTVRNLSNEIIQFEYGIDSINPVESEEEKVNKERIFLDIKNFYKKNKTDHTINPNEEDKIIEPLNRAENISLKHKQNLKDDKIGMDFIKNSDKKNNLFDFYRESYCKNKNQNVHTKNKSVDLLTFLSTSLKQITNLEKEKILTFIRNSHLEPDSYDIIMNLFDINHNKPDILLNNTEEYDTNSYSLLTSDPSRNTSIDKLKFILNFLCTYFSERKKIRIDAKSPVGVLAGQSIGEPGTQMTLKTFHFAGVSSMNITLGVPRLKEIINVNKKISTPIITAYSKFREIEKIKNTVENIKPKKLKDIIHSIKEIIMHNKIEIQILIDPDRLENREKDNTLNNNTDTLEKNKNFPDQEEDKQNIQTQEKTYKNIPKNRKDEKVENTIDNKKPKIIPKNIMKNILSIAEKIKNDLKINNISIKNNLLIIDISDCPKKDNYYYKLKNISRSIIDINISGIESIGNIAINKDLEILMEGDGLLKILGSKGIDPTRTISNNIIEIYETLGIEAARNIIIKEIEYTMFNHGIRVDHRHTTLLSDVMCSKGEPLGITRFGISKMKISTFMMASFEQTAEYLFDAAIENKKDKLIGVSENIIVGNEIPLGTGLIEVFQE